MRSGFSLLELSIVLVIIGLLAGGVMTGQSLIHAAELRAVTTEYGRYITAMNAFRDKYQAIPGDMKNATAFWGAAHATALTCETTVGTGTQTCNGNGDGIVGVLADGSFQEMFRYWQQLNAAGLIEGNYTGVQGASASDAVIGSNVPASRYPNAGWAANLMAGYNAGNGAVFAGTYNNHFVFGAQNPGYLLGVIAISPPDAWNIDSKLDDGKPAIGKVVANNWSTCTNAASQTDLAANYSLTSTAIGCAFYVKW